MTEIVELPSIAALRGKPEFLAVALLLGAERYLEEPTFSQDLSHIIPTYVSGPRELLSPAFSFGCTDYLREPWSVEELLARLRPRLDTLKWRYRDRQLQLKGCTLRCEGREIQLASQEQRILRLLILNQGEPVERRFIETVANGSGRQDCGANSRALDICVSRLRGKLFRLLDLGDSADPIIASVYGVGYLLDCG